LLALAQGWLFKLMCDARTAEHAALKFVEANNLQAAFRDRQVVNRNAASEKNLNVKNAIRHPIIPPICCPINSNCSGLDEG
jgi:hypothetical protein